MPTTTTPKTDCIIHDFSQIFSHSNGALIDVDMGFLRLYNSFLIASDPLLQADILKHLEIFVLENRKDFGSKNRFQWAALTIADIYLTYYMGSPATTSQHVLDCLKYIKEPLSTKITILVEYSRACGWFLDSLTKRVEQSAINAYIHLKNSLDISSRIEYRGDGLMACKLLLKLSSNWKYVILAFDSQGFLATFRLAVDCMDQVLRAGVEGENMMACKRLFCYLHYETCLAYEHSGLFGQAKKHVEMAIESSDVAPKEFNENMLYPTKYRIDKKVLPFSCKDIESESVFLIEQAAVSEDADFAKLILRKAIKILTPVYVEDIEPSDIMTNMLGKVVLPSYEDDLLKYRFVLENFINCYLLAKRHAISDLILWTSCVLSYSNWPTTFPDRDDRRADVQLTFIKCMLDSKYADKFQKFDYDKFVSIFQKVLEYAKSLADSNSMDLCVYMRKNIVRLITNFYEKHGRKLFSENQWIAFFASFIIPALCKDDKRGYQSFLYIHAQLQYANVKGILQAAAEKAASAAPKEKDKKNKQEAVKIPDTKPLEIMCLEAINMSDKFSFRVLHFIYILYELQGMRTNTAFFMDMAEPVLPASQLVFLHRLGEDVNDKNAQILKNASNKLLAMQNKNFDTGKLNLLILDLLKLYEFEDLYVKHLEEIFSQKVLNDENKELAVLKLIQTALEFAQKSNDSAMAEKASNYIQNLSESTNYDLVLNMFYDLSQVPSIPCSALRKSLNHVVSFFQKNMTKYQLNEIESDKLSQAAKKYFDLEKDTQIDMNGLIKGVKNIITRNQKLSLSWLQILWAIKCGSHPEELQGIVNDGFSELKDLPACVWFSLTDKLTNSDFIHSAYVNCLDMISDSNDNLAYFTVSKLLFEIQNGIKSLDSLKFVEFPPIILKTFGKPNSYEKILAFNMHVLKSFTMSDSLDDRHQHLVDAIPLLLAVFEGALDPAMPGVLTDANKPKIDSIRKTGNITELDACINLLIYNTIDFNAFVLIGKVLDIAVCVWYKNPDLLLDAYGMLLCIATVQDDSEKIQKYKQVLSSLTRPESPSSQQGMTSKRILPWFSFMILFRYGFFNESITLYLKLRGEIADLNPVGKLSTYAALFDDLMYLASVHSYIPSKVLYTASIFATKNNFLSPRIIEAISSNIVHKRYNILWNVLYHTDDRKFIHYVEDNWSMIKQNCILANIGGMLLSKILNTISTNLEEFVVNSGIELFSKILNIMHEMLHRNCTCLTDISNNEVNFISSYLDILELKFWVHCYKLHSTRSSAHQLNVVEKYLKSLEEPKLYEGILESSFQKCNEIGDRVAKIIDSPLNGQPFVHRLELILTYLKYRELILENTSSFQDIYASNYKNITLCLYHGYHELSTKILNAAFSTDSKEIQQYSNVLLLLFCANASKFEKLARKSFRYDEDLFLARKWALNFDNYYSYISYERACRNVREAHIEWKNARPKTNKEIELLFKSRDNESIIAMCYSLDGSRLFVGSSLQKPPPPPPASKKKQSAAAVSTEPVFVESMACFSASLQSLEDAVKGTKETRDTLLTAYFLPIKGVLPVQTALPENAVISVYADPRIDQTVDFGKYLSLRVEKKLI